MNKLVIVGNGFDLAHGLPTSYRNFIDDFWSSFHQNHQKPETISLITFNLEFLANLSLSEIKCFEDFSQRLKSYCVSSRYDFDESKMYCRSSKFAGFSVVFEFKNALFKQINLKSLENWVDIENEYYQNLKTISKRKVKNYVGSLEDAEKNQIIENKKAVAKLNYEFEEVKILLEQYLLKEVHHAYNLTKFIGQKWIKLHHLLQPISFLNNEIPLSQEFLMHEDWKEIENLFEIEKNGGERTTHTFILNFNYTLVTSQYLYEIYREKYRERIIHIHGILSNDSNNKMNFGFGDEMDEDYKLIENLGDNEYLMNFKSFKYLQNSNYQKLLRIIESEKFQVNVMGHSCGLSDRTLLNTIFEHRNCRSIKVFYHQREDGSDNFTEIIQNISRHFNDKKLMRSKIVNKSLCSPLPQNIRFQKKS